MTLPFIVTVPGEPHGKGSVKVRRTGRPCRVCQQRPNTSTYYDSPTPERMALFEQHFRLRWRNAPPIDGPVELVLVCIASRPGRLLRQKDPDGIIWRDRKPDWDNEAKLLADPLEKAGVLTNDSRIVLGTVVDGYAERDGKPRTVVVLRRPPSVWEALDSLGVAALFPNLTRPVEGLLEKTP